MNEWEEQNLPPSLPPRRQPLPMNHPPEPPAVWPWVLGFGLAVALLVVAPIVAVVLVASSSITPVASKPAPRMAQSAPNQPVQLPPVDIPQVEIPQSKPPRPFPDNEPVRKPNFPPVTPPKVPLPRIEPPVIPPLPTPNKPPIPAKPSDDLPEDTTDEVAAPGKVLIYLAQLKPDSTSNVKELKSFQHRSAFALDGKKLSHGIWAQPNTDKGTSRIVYTLDGKYDKLTGSAGFSDLTARFPSGSRLTPSVRFAVWGDGEVLWQSRKVTGRGDKTSFHLDIQGVKKLTLVAESYTYAYMSNCVWGNLMLEGPQPMPKD